MDDTWAWATGAVLVGLLSGMVGAALVHRIIVHDRAERREVVDAARAAAIFIFMFFLAIGLVVAVGVTSPETLRPIPADVLEYSPRVLAAGLILIAGRAIAYATGGLVVNAPGEITSRSRQRLAVGLRVVITVTSLVLALSQLGVDTTILQLAIGALFFGGAATFALLVGFGGRQLGGNLAAGRYLQRVIRVGDVVEVGDIVGRIAAIHPATLEIELDEQRSVHVPHSRVIDSSPVVRRRDRGARSAVDDRHSEDF